MDCAYVVRAPKGYYVQIKLNRFDIELRYSYNTHNIIIISNNIITDLNICCYSSGCSKDYVQMYYGTELTSNNVVQFSQNAEGRICDNRGYTLTYTIFTDVVTVFFHTDGSGSGRRGLSVTFTAIGNLVVFNTDSRRARYFV